MTTSKKPHDWCSLSRVQAPCPAVTYGGIRLAGPITASGGSSLPPQLVSLHFPRAVYKCHSGSPSRTAPGASAVLNKRQMNSARKFC
jgi:hypothetical protein